MKYSLVIIALLGLCQEQANAITRYSAFPGVTFVQKRNKGDDDDQSEGDDDGEEAGDVDEDEQQQDESQDV